MKWYVIVVLIYISLIHSFMLFVRSQQIWTFKGAPLFKCIVPNINAPVSVSSLSVLYPGKLFYLLF